MSRHRALCEGVTPTIDVLNPTSEYKAALMPREIRECDAPSSGSIDYTCQRCADPRPDFRCSRCRHILCDHCCLTVPTEKKIFIGICEDCIEEDDDPHDVSEFCPTDRVTDPGDESVVGDDLVDIGHKHECVTCGLPKWLGAGQPELRCGPHCGQPKYITRAEFNMMCPDNTPPTMTNVNVCGCRNAHNPFHTCNGGCACRCNSTKYCRGRTAPQCATSS